MGASPLKVCIHPWILLAVMHHCSILKVILFFIIGTLIVVAVTSKGHACSHEPEEFWRRLHSVRTGHFPKIIRENFKRDWL